MAVLVLQFPDDAILFQNNFLYCIVSCSLWWEEDSVNDMDHAIAGFDVCTDHVNVSIDCDRISGASDLQRSSVCGRDHLRRLQIATENSSADNVVRENRGDLCNGEIAGKMCVDKCLIGRSKHSEGTGRREHRDEVRILNQAYQCRQRGRRNRGLNNIGQTHTARRNKHVIYDSNDSVARIDSNDLV